MKKTIYYTFILILITSLGCNNHQSKKNNYSDYERKKESIKYYPKNDSIFLGLMLGMSKHDYNEHIKKLISNRKISLENGKYIYVLKFKDRLFKHTFSASKKGIIDTKFFNNRLCQLSLTFLKPEIYGWDMITYGHLLRILENKYGKASSTSDSDEGENISRKKDEFGGTEIVHYMKYSTCHSVWDFTNNYEISLLLNKSYTPEIDNIIGDHCAKYQISSKVKNQKVTLKYSDKNIDIEQFNENVERNNDEEYNKQSNKDF